ncbi:unnamed protein product [Phyllotreta striolata]|uniref:C2H2-type domain-containing protein n=1 Tax=Phyllotreta striolata TaxID=444603 RepID=A0A9N9U173_PHYSR|nr:unnamed protein product [Phyllotreta striolata]
MPDLLEPLPAHQVVAAALALPVQPGAEVPVLDRRLPVQGLPEGLAEEALGHEARRFRLLIRFEQADGRKHRCTTCGKSFNHNSTLWYHKKFACADKKTYRCPVCRTTTSYESTLKRHLKDKHGVVK